MCNVVILGQVNSGRMSGRLHFDSQTFLVAIARRTCLVFDSAVFSKSDNPEDDMSQDSPERDLTMKALLEHQKCVISIFFRRILLLHTDGLCCFSFFTHTKYIEGYAMRDKVFSS
jgi:hypothetical protein